MKTTLKIPKAENQWFDISDHDYAIKTLHAIGDDVKREILISFIDTPRTINEVLRMRHISHTSGYRKVKSLIDDGLLVSTNLSIEYGKPVNRYKSIFKNFLIQTEENKIIMKIQLNSIVRGMYDLPSQLT
ncbi:MAG TPA: hypothetical protein VLA53_05860 [Nitrosopumilaceae archaeon]|nr:hypothetical protein [Nitrosopumilaceae archaeon]